MAKKSFMTSDNPAMQFISAPAPETAAPASAAESITAAEPVMTADPVMTALPVMTGEQSEASDIFAIPPKSSEHKSKRAQLLMTPSLHEKVAKKAASLNMSFNELVNIVLEKYVQ